MKLADPRLWLGCLSAAAVVYLVHRDIERTTPADLTSVHRREPDLAARDGCALCHGDGEVSLTQACLECHGTIGLQIEASHGLHGSLDPNVAQACAVCHSEHHGEDFAIVNERSFAIAGVPDVLAFDHGPVGFPMEGAHLELECNECHANAIEPVLERGETRFIGLDQDCAACHEDPHEGRMLRGCAECHGQEAFDLLTPFVHDERFPLEGSHANTGCLDCHAERTRHSVEALDRSGPPAEWRSCQDCHESPHRMAVAAAWARLVDMPVEESCEVCHPAAHETFRDAGDELTVSEHALTGFALETPHEDLTCNECHADQETDFFERYPGRRADQCWHCHGDPHRGYFANFTDDVVAASAVECRRCHLSTSFMELPETGFDHGRWTGFSIRGSHAQSACESCHPSTEAPDELGRSFGWASAHFGEVRGCVTCHVDPHQGSFDEESLPALVEGRSDCARCHDERSFRTAADRFDHALWTGFPLDAAHGEQSCSACHASLREPDPVGRTWQRAAGDSCASCHDNPHGGQFEVEGQTDCRRCHESTARFSELTFDHDRDSRFPLDESHESVACSACHRPSSPGGFGVVRYRPIGTECADCHGVNRGLKRLRGEFR